MNPTVAVLENGNFVIVWAEAVGPDERILQVSGQMFDPDGAKVGDQFVVGGTNAIDGFEMRPAVIALDTGGFAVTWTDGRANNALLSIYDQEGVIVADSIAVGSIDAEEVAGIVQLANGDIALSYVSETVVNVSDINFRRFDTDGTPVGAETTIFSGDNTLFYASIAKLPDGGFVIGWEDGTAQQFRARLRVINADGTPRTDVITASAAGTENGNVAVLGLPDGGFIASWSQSTGSDINVAAQRYDSDGSPLGGIFIVNQTTAGVQGLPSLNPLESGGFVVTWVTEGDDFEVIGREYDANSQPIGGEFGVNTTTFGAHSQAYAQGTVGDFGNGVAIVVWSGNGPGDPTGIFYRTFAVTPGDGGDNTDPVATNDTAVVDEDGTVVISVLANDSDADMDALSVSGVSDPANGTVVINADGTITYTPDANFNGNDSFTYTISDGNGGSDTASVTVTVNPVNDDPVASDDTAMVDEDGSVVISVLANDSDADMDALSISAVTDPSNGTVVVNADGTITYTPDADFNGSDSFTYTISDGNGGSDTASVSVTVNPVNDDPVASDDTAMVDEDGSVVISVLANDSDADMDALSISGVTDPANGTVVINADGTITYTPDADFNGNDSFTYTISDGNGGSDTASVTVTVNPVNDDPVASDDTAVVDEDGSVVISVLANDSDVDMDALSISGVTDPVNGSVVINADGTITYTPDAGFSGDDSFTYTISDGNGGSDSASVSVTVNAVDGGDADAVDDAFATDEATRVTSGNVFDANPSSPDTDPDGALRVTAVNGQAANVGVQIALASGALLTLNADGSFIYDPNGAFDDLPGACSGASNLTATDSFTYELNGEDTATVTITINGLDSDGDVLVGTDGDDRLDGGIGADTMSGGLGDDLYFVDNVGDRVVERGDGGRDTVVTTVDFAAGDEEIEVIRAASDTGLVLTAGNIDTILNGGAGDDTLIGGTGNDNLRGMEGADVMRGGLGDDSYLVHDAGDVVIELAGEGRDTVFAYTDFNAAGAEIEVIRSRVNSGVRLQASDIDTNISGLLGDDTLIGGEGNDVLTGWGGDDRLRGGRGDDNLRGGEGNDILIGGAGNDVLKGDQGTDMLEGGAGSDIFLFDDGDSSADLATADQILDFSQADGDLINLARIDAVEGGDDDAFTFIGEAAFSGTAGELRFEQTDGQTHIFGDTNGDGIADFALVLDNTIPLTAADFTF